MRGQQGNGYGARRRFLQDQNEVMAMLGHDPVSKRELKPKVFGQGGAHEQLSGEGQRRKTVAAEMGYSGIAAGAGTAASGVTGAKLAGTSVGQSYLEGRARLARNPAEKESYRQIARAGRWASKNPKRTTAMAATAGAIGAVASRAARMRSNEEAGMSHEIGRMKAGSTYRRDVQRISKSRLAANLLVELDRGAPGLKRAKEIITAHPKKSAAGVLVPTAAAGTYDAQRRGRVRTREVKAVREEMAKREPLRTSISRNDAKRLERQYGLKGPLPKGLTREQKMAAYEARYVRAGGHKAEKWHNRAERSEKIRTAGVGAGALAGAAFLGAKAGAGRTLAPLARRTPLKRVNRGHLETAGVGVGTVTAAAEVDAMYARRKRSSYASAPGGVAASALRRMKAYTPTETPG